MSKKVWAVVALSLIAIVVGYTYVTVSDGPIMPLGRLVICQNIKSRYVSWKCSS